MTLNSEDEIAENRDSLTIISHRARGFGYPENSEAAFRAVLASKISEVELDLYFARNKKFLASHWPPLFSFGKKSMTLDEILEIFYNSLNNGDKKHLRLDIKNRGGEDYLVKLLEEKNLLERVTIMSRSTKALFRYGRISSRLRLSKTVFLTGFFPKLDQMIYRFVCTPIIDQETSSTKIPSITLYSLSGEFSEEILRSSLASYEEVVCAVSHVEQIRKLAGQGVKKYLSPSPQLMR